MKKSESFKKGNNNHAEDINASRAITKNIMQMKESGKETRRRERAVELAQTEEEITELETKKANWRMTVQSDREQSERLKLLLGRASILTMIIAQDQKIQDAFKKELFSGNSSMDLPIQ